MAVKRITASRAFQPAVAGHGFLFGQAAWYYRPECLRSSVRSYASNNAPEDKPNSASSSESSSNSSFRPEETSNWEDNPDLDITAFSQLPHRHFGTNQHIRINEDFKESLRQILWQFRAPIRYAFAYGSGVFSQSSSATSAEALTPHPHPPEAVRKWQQGGGKIIDFIFGVSYTQHWHSINLQQHKNHYSGLRWGGSYPISKIQDSLGAGVYFNPYITVNGVMIKYGVVNLDTICRDLTEWDTLYLAGRLQKPVKILRDDPRVRLANQINLMSAMRTALLMLPETFTEKQLYETIAGISYLGDPRMSLGGENMRKVSNIVSNQLPNFRQLYVPLINNLPNVEFKDNAVPKDIGWEREEIMAKSGRNPTDVPGGKEGFAMHQDMDTVKRGNMVRRLPKGFRQKLYYQYQKKFQIPGSAFDQIIDQATDEDATGFHRRQGGEFEQRIGQQDDLSDVVSQCIRGTVSWPSTIQSIKGAFTAGIGRSWRYYNDKRSKNREGKLESGKSATKEQGTGEKDLPAKKKA